MQTQPEYKDLFLPHFVAFLVLSCAWIWAWISPTEKAKKVAFIAYVFCILIINEGFHAYNLINGEIFAYFCRQEELDRMNQIHFGSMTFDGCVEEYGSWLWV